MFSHTFVIRLYIRAVNVFFLYDNTIDFHPINARTICASTPSTSNNYHHPPLITLYVARMCAIEAAGAVNAIPSAHSSDPPTATFRYENSCSSGPTNKPLKFMHTSSVLMMTDAPVVLICRSRSISPNSKPNDGSIERVASCVQRRKQ